MHYKRVLILLLLLLTGCQRPPAVSASSVPGGPTAAGSGQSSPYSSSETPPVNLVLSYSGPETSVNGWWALQYKQLVEQLSGGTITIDVYSDSILGSDLEVVRDCQYGTVDIQIASPSALVTFIPEAAVFDVPFLFQSLEQARAALADPVLFRYLSNAYEEKELILMPLADQGFRELSLSQPIQSLTDLQGLTIRCLYNEHHTAFWQALGLETVSMDIADVYLALQKGGIQGEENPYAQIHDRKFYELQKYMTNSDHLLFVGGMHISKATWDSLSSDDQETLWQAAEECRMILPDYVDQANEQALEQMSREGISLIDFDAIPGLRAQCRALTYEAAYESVVAVTGAEILDRWCSSAAGTSAPE